MTSRPLVQRTIEHFFQQAPGKISNKAQPLRATSQQQVNSPTSVPAGLDMDFITFNAQSMDDIRLGEFVLHLTKHSIKVAAIQSTLNTLQGPFHKGDYVIYASPVVKQDGKIRGGVHA